MLLRGCTYPSIWPDFAISPRLKPNSSQGSRSRLEPLCRVSSLLAYKAKSFVTRRAGSCRVAFTVNNLAGIIVHRV